jgi:hypothetical protein
MTTSDPSTFITFQQVLKDYPYLTSRWLRRAVFEKKVPHYKLGGRLLFDPVELDQWIRNQRVEPVAAKPVKRIPRHKKVTS